MMRIRGGTGALAAGLTVAVLVGCGDGAVKSRETRTAKAAPEKVGAVAMASAADPAPAGGVRGARAASAATSPSNVTYGDAERVYRAGRYGEAADLFEGYAARRPGNPWGTYMLGISAWKAGDHARAEAALRRTLQVAPDHEKALLNLARVLLEEGRASDALDPAEQVVGLDSTSGEAWRVLGNARSDLGMVEEAVSAYRRALVLDHRDAWTMNNLGLLMIREGRYEEALPPLARATELRPEQAVFQNNLGVALERSGHTDQAAVAFQAALDAKPGYENARVSLERAQARQGAVPAPLDLTTLAGSFADEVSGWREEQEARAARPDTAAPDETSKAPAPVSPHH